MLEGLDSIDWDLLGHANGPAGDVPGLIRPSRAGGSARSAPR